MIRLLNAPQTDHECITTAQQNLWEHLSRQHQHTADLPSEVLDADSVLGVRVRSAHLHLELWVKQQHKVDPAVVSVHVHQEGIFHHQPAPRPAETELMVTDAVQALDPMTSRPLEDGSLPKTSRHMLHIKALTCNVSPLSSSQDVYLQAFGSKIGDEGESADGEELQLEEKQMRKRHHTLFI